MGRVVPYLGDEYHCMQLINIRLEYGPEPLFPRKASLPDPNSYLNARFAGCLKNTLPLIFVSAV